MMPSPWHIKMTGLPALKTRDEWSSQKMEIEDRKTWERRQRQDRIIDIAEKLFLSQGVEQTTMERIARAAGYTKQTLYLYFKNKEDLIAAVVLRKLNMIYDAVDKALITDNIGLECLRSLATAYYRFFQENAAYIELIVKFFTRNYAYGRTIDPETDGFFMAECQKVNDATIDIILSTIKQGITDGSIKTSRKPQHLMILLWAQMLGVLQTVSMRNVFFEETYQMSAEEFFAYFMENIEISLTHTL